MKELNRIMVGIDFTLIDKTLIQYTAFLAHYLHPEKIYFINVQSNLDVPDSIRQAFPELNQPRDEKLLEDMKARVQNWFPNHHEYPIDYQIIEGVPRKELVRWVHIKNIDLLLVGRKDPKHGKGIVPQQLARKIGCSLMFIPEQVQYRLSQILVANDFSEYARAALETALAFQSTDPEIKVYSGHVFALPQGYSRTGKSEEEFASIMEAHARDRYQSFVEEIPDSQQIQALYCYDKAHRSAARVLHETVKEKEIDLMMVGSRGHTATSAFLLGSVSEKLIRINETTPILMVKEAQTIGLQKVVEGI